MNSRMNKVILGNMMLFTKMKMRATYIMGEGICK